MNTLTSNYNSATNHNLSSVLSQIQDNGPAYTEPGRQQNAYTMAADENTPVQEAASKPQREASYDDDTLSLSTAGLKQEQEFHTTNTTQAKKEISPGIWLQLLLLLISAALLAATLFRLDVQENSFETSLNDYDEIIDEKIQESVDYQKQHSSGGSSKINAMLQALQEELKHIKTDYSALDKKYVALSQKQPAEETQNTASIQEDVSAFKHEIISLKSELQAVKSKLNTIKTDKNLSAQMPAGNDLTVMLASLTNKIKAEKIVQQLYAEGLKPSIKQAIVKGERVYRLTVSGFFNRDEAESFIRKADKKYGMKDSRIRKS